jgi:hypothetical protein
MSERPILFSAPMIRSILAGRKTQTRRVIRDTGLYAIDDAIHGATVAARERENLLTQSPIKAGDTLWVRESFCAPEGLDKPASVIYRADWSDEDLSASDAARRRFPEIARAYPDTRWRPSIHMPRSMARILLRVTEVRIERLQEVTPDQCRAEGHPTRPEISNDPEVHDDAARDWFMDLWDTLNEYRGYGWKSNPWVWAITFERIRE